MRRFMDDLVDVLLIVTLLMAVIFLGGVTVHFFKYGPGTSKHNEAQQAIEEAGK